MIRHVIVLLTAVLVWVWITSMLAPAPIVHRATPEQWHQVG